MKRKEGVMTKKQDPMYIYLVLDHKHNTVHLLETDCKIGGKNEEQTIASAGLPGVLVPADRL
jgi:hypothetical protein